MKEIYLEKKIKKEIRQYFKKIEAIKYELKG